MSFKEKLGYAFKHIRWTYVFGGMPFILAGMVAYELLVYHTTGLSSAKNTIFALLVSFIISFLSEIIPLYRKAGAK